MKTQLTITFYKPGVLNKYAAVIAALNNEGSYQFSITDLCGYMTCKVSEYPFILKSIKVELKKNQLVIMENGVDQNILIEERKVPQNAQQN
jgi:hypothetical protein